jgi:DNA polymerase elongation subunit (family B)
LKILVADIETAPNVVHAWGLYNINVALNQIVTPGRVLCFAAKWHEDKSKVMFYSEFHHGRETMLQAAYDLLDEADVVVGWNSKKFDVPWLMGEFAKMGWTPPSPFSQIDLCLVARRTFKLTSNRLDWVAGELLGEHKLSTGGHGLWTACLNGDEKAWKTMQRYNVADVRITDRLLERLKPWVKDWPNPQLYSGADPESCPQCGSENLVSRGLAYTKLSAYRRYRCSDCGRWARGQKRVIGADVR